MLVTREWINEQVKAADNLAKQARAAALAGEHGEARRLRDEFDRVYDAIFAALDSQPVGALSPELVETQALALAQP